MVRLALCIKRRPNLLPPNHPNMVRAFQRLLGAEESCQHPLSWSNSNIGVCWENGRFYRSTWRQMISLYHTNSLLRMLPANWEANPANQQNPVDNTRSSSNYLWAMNGVYSRYCITVLSNINDRLHSPLWPLE